MAKFEGYERREAKILACLKEYGINSIDECKEICDAYGIDPYKIVEETQPICFENAKWAYTVGAAIAIKKGCTPDMSLHLPFTRDPTVNLEFFINETQHPCEAFGVQVLERICHLVSSSIYYQCFHLSE